MNRPEFAKHLYDRMKRAQIIQPIDDPAWNGEANKCHENVKRWIGLHPNHRPVRGYLITSASEVGAMFELHSIVQHDDATIVNVTPLALPCGIHWMRSE